MVRDGLWWGQMVPKSTMGLGSPWPHNHPGPQSSPCSCIPHLSPPLSPHIHPTSPSCPPSNLPAELSQPLSEGCGFGMSPTPSAFSAVPVAAPTRRSPLQGPVPQKQHSHFGGKAVRGSAGTRNSTSPTSTSIWAGKRRGRAAPAGHNPGEWHSQCDQPRQSPQPWQQHLKQELPETPPNLPV